MFMESKICHDYDKHIYFQFCNQIQSKEYGNNMSLYKEGIVLVHFKCKADDISDHLRNESIINHNFYYFMPENSYQDGMTTAAHMKMSIKEICDKHLLIPRSINI